MFQHRIYGINIKSSRRITILHETDFEVPDITVNWHKSDARLENERDWQPVNTKLLDLIEEVSLWESGGETFRITKAEFTPTEGTLLTFIFDPNGSQLDIHYSDKELGSNLESYFVGPIMSFVLRLNGQVSLHSSAVGVDGKAIAFLGHSTAGKSTIAAGMAKAGAKILADDIVALTFEEDRFYVQSGYSRVRLRPKAAKFLTPDPAKLPRVYSYRDSFYYSLQTDDNFEQNSLPLGAIYLLGKFSEDYREPVIKPVPSQEKLIKLIENASGSYVVNRDLRANEFEVFSEIANTIPIRRLYYAHDMETLPKQCELLLNDFRNLSKLAKPR